MFLGDMRVGGLILFSEDKSVGGLSLFSEDNNFGGLILFSEEICLWESILLLQDRSNFVLKVLLIRNYQM